MIALDLLAAAGISSVTLVAARRWRAYETRLIGMGLALAALVLVRDGSSILFAGVAYGFVRAWYSFLAPSGITPRPALALAAVYVALAGLALAAHSPFIPLPDLPYLTVYGLTLLALYWNRQWFTTQSGALALVFSLPALGYLLAGGGLLAISALPVLWYRMLLECKPADRRAALVILMPMAVTLL